MARALDVSPSTLSGWESGRDPVGEIRTKYAYLLDGLNAKLATETEAAPTAERPVTSGTAPTAPPLSLRPTSAKTRTGTTWSCSSPPSPVCCAAIPPDNA
ncbi:hypothetical protein ACFTY7_39415 [Streptomyces sp. NPDC057062]|uniref:hypothetical protein n=1 Tax=Streptomyces sp. NPDC057062 TaxID=3346011 RepID=UPI003637722E